LIITCAPDTSIMPQPVEVISQTGSDASEYLDTESARSYDTLDELLSRFTLEFKPEYVVKIRNR
jgi:hypothetical protein